MFFPTSANAASTVLLNIGKVNVCTHSAGMKNKPTPSQELLLVCHIYAVISEPRYSIVCPGILLHDSSSTLPLDSRIFNQFIFCCFREQESRYCGTFFTAGTPPQASVSSSCGCSIVPLVYAVQLEGIVVIPICGSSSISY